MIAAICVLRPRFRNRLSCCAVDAWKITCASSGRNCRTSLLKVVLNVCSSSASDGRVHEALDDVEAVALLRVLLALLLRCKKRLWASVSLFWIELGLL